MNEITFLYKANLRGAKEQWLALVEDLENGKSTPIETLKYLLSRLINAASNFDNAAKKLLDATNQIIGDIKRRKFSPVNMPLAQFRVRTKISSQF